MCDRFPVAQLKCQLIELGALGIDVDEAMLDIGGCLLGSRLSVTARLAGVGGGELPGCALQGGREEEGLAVGRGLGKDPIDRGLEPHIEHPVGLIEDEDADPLH